jgi:predicted DNA-binding transcriptional regulator YafY
VASRAVRLITLIMLLQRRPNQRAAELADALGVSVRSLHRYIAELDEMGIPVYSERGPHGGFSLVRGYKMPPLVFTPEEAVAVYLGASLVRETWGRLYAEAAGAALAKLDNLLPHEQRQEVAWAQRSLVAYGQRTADLAALAPRLEALRGAVRERRRIDILYAGMSHPEPTRRAVDPYALVHRWGWWYAVGYCHRRQGVRMFRLDRMVELAVLDARFSVPPRFDVKAFLDTQAELAPHIRSSIRFLPEWAHLPRDTRGMWEAVEEQADGSVLVTLLSPNLPWAAVTVMGFGPTFVVEGPSELREMVAEWAVAMARMHAGGAEAAAHAPATPNGYSTDANAS